MGEVAGRTLLRHTGGMVAFSSAMHVDVTSGVGAFASVNANLAGYRPNVVANYALDLMRAAIDGRDLPAAPSTTTTPDQIANARDYSGTFTSADGMKLILTSEGSKLWLAIGSRRVQLERRGQDFLLARHPDFELFGLEFGREKDAVVEVFHGARWFTNERYSGPKTFDYPKEWDTFTGHYRNDSPWFGSARIFIRKGKLTADPAARPASVAHGGAGIGPDESRSEMGAVRQRTTRPDGDHGLAAAALHDGPAEPPPDGRA